MKIRTFAAGLLAASMFAGAAVAQQASSTADPSKPMNNMSFASDDEKMMYTDNGPMLAPFFTDESMSTLRSEAEVKSAFGAMDANSQAGMKSACERTALNRSSYGTVTNALCDQIGTM